MFGHEQDFEFRNECGAMDDDRFHMLMDVLKILEKYENEGTKESIVEIIDSFDENLSPEQKASVLREFLNFRKKTEDRRRRFDEQVHREQMEEFLNRNDFF